MTTDQVDHYSELSEQYLRHARTLLSEGGLPQASEKAWGAAALAVKACAEARSWKHGGHRELYRVVRGLADEVQEPELRRQFNIAGHLHTNYYEDNRDPEDIEHMLVDVDSLVGKLREVREPAPDG